MPLKLKERNILDKLKMPKNPNWWEPDHLDIFRHEQWVGLGSTKKQL